MRPSPSEPVTGWSPAHQPGTEHEGAGDQQRAAAWRRLRRRRPRAPPRRVEGGVLGEYRRLERSELRAGLDADLIDERRARPPVGLERVGLATTAVQREHQLAVKALAERLIGDGGLELPDELRMASERQLRVDPGLERRRALLGEPRDLGLGVALVGEVRERRPAPQRERLAQRVRGALRIGIQPAASIGGQRLEAVDVALARADVQR
jgi:hypothetical protein